MLYVLLCKAGRCSVKISDSQSESIVIEKLVDFEAG